MSSNYLDIQSRFNNSVTEMNHLLNVDNFHSAFDITVCILEIIRLFHAVRRKVQ